MSERTSTKTGTAPRSATAFAVETKVKDGMITSSPGPSPARIAHISRAPVAECVNSAFADPVCSSSHVPHLPANGPFPERWPFAIASAT